MRNGAERATDLGKARLEVVRPISQGTLRNRPLSSIPQSRKRLRHSDGIGAIGAPSDRQGHRVH